MGGRSNVGPRTLNLQTVLYARALLQALRDSNEQ